MAGGFKITAVIEGVAQNVEPTDENGQATYYVHYDSQHTDQGQVTKFDATRPTDGINVKYTISYDKGEGPTLTNDEIDAAYLSAYAEQANKVVKVTFTSTSRVKIGSDAATAQAATTANSTGIVVSLGSLPSSITGGSYTSSVSEDALFFGIIGQNGLDTTSTEFGNIVATVSFAAS